MGTLGPVFRTYEPARDRLVAVKVFRLDLTPEQSQALADQLARSAEADLFHPSIVEPIAAGIEGTLAYRAEEYVAAESLDVAMRHYAPASLETVVRIVGQIGAALDAARAAGVGHGGLHPRDVFVTPDEARASGFGVVDALERIGVRAPVRRPYSAPERIAGESWDLPADVFSLAAIAFELLTGRRPSAPGVGIGLLTGAQLATPQPVHDVLMRAMDEDPDARFGTGQAFVEALESAGAAAGPSAMSVAPAFVDEPGPRSIRMIPIPVEAPEFADEEIDEDESDAMPLSELPLVESPAEDQPSNVDAPAETGLIEDDIDTERDEDLRLWALSRDHAVVADDIAARPPSKEAHEQPDEDSIALDAAELALFEPGRTARDEDAIDAEDRFGHSDAEADVLAEPVEEGEEPSSRDTAPMVAAGPALFESLSDDPPRVIERDPGPQRSQEPSGGVALAEDVASERPAGPAVGRLAAVLAMGLVVGLAIGYIVWGRDQSSEPVARVESAPATTETAAPAPVLPSLAVNPPAGSRESSAPASARPAGAAAKPPAAPAAAKAGKLVVNSTPAGANVIINGRWSGRTPLTRDAIALGGYRVQLTLPGYQSRREQLTLTAGAASRTLSVQLQANKSATAKPADRPTAGAAGTAAPPAAGTAQRAVGLLEVESRPAGARVFVDGTPLGNTPLKLPDVTAGEHTIRLELAGHQPWTQNTQVARGRTTRVAGSLEPIR